jgi:heme A synthase
VLLGVVLQGPWAGGFIGHLAGTFWLQLHRITAYVVVILALAAAILAVVTQRRRRAIAACSVGLFVLVAVEAEFGHVIGEGGWHSLVAVHVPAAMLIMGLGVYLSIAGARARRSS